MGIFKTISGDFSTKATKQSKPIYGKDQVLNNAGGYVYQIDKWQQLKRFLILGSEGSTYYASAQKFTTDNANATLECIKEDGKKVLGELTHISTNGLAPKNDAAIFILALCCTYGNPDTQKLAYKTIPTVCRTGTHLFMFMENITTLRGWSRGLREGVSNWYRKRNADDLAYQVLKYQNRENWRHRDVLNLAHPKPVSPAMNDLFNYIVTGETRASCPDIVTAYKTLTANPKKALALDFIEMYNFPREMIPTTLLNDPDIWNALLQKMPTEALVRNLGKMGSIGLLTDNLQTEVKKVVEKLTNADYIKRSMIHPMKVLVGLKTYAQGYGFKGSLKWNVVPKIYEALNAAFYLSFGNIVPTGKNYLLAIDVSGSMSSLINDNSVLTCAEAAAAMAMITARTEQNYSILGFADRFINLGITPSMDLETCLKKVQYQNFGGTDCAIPVIYAYANKLEVDTFIVYTDSETWIGEIHPSQALQIYRKNYKPDAKLVVAAFSANNMSIADPNDKGMLDCAGFSADLPNIINQFSSGTL